jgi:hypothetical protein
MNKITLTGRAELWETARARVMKEITQDENIVITKVWSKESIG